jgi:anti-sigma regulatory factor (Ser/Thr protein kinase)/CheY-like chemotaxis protein
MMQIFADKTESTLQGVSYLRKAARLRLQELRLPKLIIDDLQLAIAEIGANVISHALQKPSQIGLKLAIRGHALHLEMSDDGSTFEGFEAVFNKLKTPVVQEDKTSGRGVDLLKSILTDLSYKSGELNIFSGKINLSPNRSHLLFIEDEKPLIDLYEMAFTGKYQVSLTSTIKDALDLVRINKIDMIIADMHLQGENIIDMLKIMEDDAELALIPTLIYTGGGDTTLHREALMLGAESVLMKPVSIAKLKQTVEWTLAKAAKQRAGLFRYFATSVDKLMEKKVPAHFRHYNLTLAEGHSGIGGGDVVVHFHYEDYDRIILADIMGHGLSASAAAISFATMTRCFQNVACPKASPSDFLNTLSKVMHHDEALASIMVTLCVMDFTSTGIVRYAMAGHPPPVIIRKRMVSTLEQGGAFLGLFPDQPYETHEITMQQGERLFLYTDGIDPYGLTASGKLPAWVMQNLALHKDFSLEQSTFTLAREIKENVSALPVDDWTVLLIEAGESVND